MGGKTAAFKADIAPIYNTVRYDLDGYDLVVPNGSYSVTLQFNEPACSAAGSSVTTAWARSRMRAGARCQAAEAACATVHWPHDTAAHR